MKLLKAKELFKLIKLIDPDEELVLYNPQYKLMFEFGNLEMGKLKHFFTIERTDELAHIKNIDGKLREKEIDLTNRKIMTVIAQNKSGCSPYFIAIKTGLCDRTIRYRLKHLFESGRILKISRNNTDPTTKYVLGAMSIKERDNIIKPIVMAEEAKNRTESRALKMFLAGFQPIPEKMKKKVIGRVIRKR